MRTVAVVWEIRQGGAFECSGLKIQKAPVIVTTDAIV